MSRKMQADQVIEAYVVDVMRRLPGSERDGIGFELHGLLAEMLADLAQAEGRPADDAMVLAMLRGFGTPAEVAARYRAPGMIVIPADGTKTFAWAAIAGLVLQWALTLPRVFDGSLAASSWWLSWGLGAFWWPGFMAMGYLLGASLRTMGLFRPKWRPRIVDPDRVDRGVLAFGLAWFAIGVGFMLCLPWLAGRMPQPFPQVFAFDPGFLHERAWPVIPLWLGSFAALAMVYANGRRTVLSRHLETMFSIGFIALLGWWIAAGDIFLAKATNDGARAALALVIAIIVVDLLVKLHRQRARIRVPKLVG
jgi:hypothetical protein